MAKPTAGVEATATCASITESDSTETVPQPRVEFPLPQFCSLGEIGLEEQGKQSE